VIARYSTFAYKANSPDLPQVARELGVRYVLDGSVRKAGDRMRITAQLIDAITGTYLWAERYDRQVTTAPRWPQRLYPIPLSKERGPSHMAAHRGG
jgi:TolB-like protein